MQNNLHLRHFEYSVIIESFCEKIIFPDNLFSSELKHLENLTVRHTPLNWKSLIPLLTHIDIVTNLDFSKNEISEIDPIPKDQNVTHFRLDGNTFDCNRCETLRFLIESYPNSSQGLECKDKNKSNDSQRYHLVNGYSIFCDA